MAGADGRAGAWGAGTPVRCRESRPGIPVGWIRAGESHGQGREGRSGGWGGRGRGWGRGGPGSVPGGWGGAGAWSGAGSSPACPAASSPWQLPPLPSPFAPATRGPPRSASRRDVSPPPVLTLPSPNSRPKMSLIPAVVSHPRRPRESRGDGASEAREGRRRRQQHQQRGRWGGPGECGEGTDSPEPPALGNPLSPWQSPGPGRGVCLAQPSVTAAPLPGERKRKGERAPRDGDAAKRPAGALTHGARGFPSSPGSALCPRKHDSSSAPSKHRSPRWPFSRPQCPETTVLPRDCSPVGRFARSGVEETSLLSFLPFSV